MEKKTENIQIVELKKNLSLQAQNLLDTETLEKYLRASNNNLEEALKNIKDYLSWKSQLDTDNLLTTDEIRDLKEFYPHGYSGVDREGRPVLIEQVGRTKLSQLFKLLEDSRLRLYLEQRMEHLRREIFPHVKKRELLVIIDLKGPIMKMASKKVYTLIGNAVKSFQRYYPETLYKMIFVNTPLLFETVWNFIKEGISPETLKKIHFVGSDFEESLSQEVDRSNLPESLGGKIDDQDLVLQDRGPWVNEVVEKDRSSESDQEQNFDFSSLKAALTNVIPGNQQVPHKEAQTPLNTQSDQKN